MALHFKLADAVPAVLALRHGQARTAQPCKESASALESEALRQPKGAEPFWARPAVDAPSFSMFPSCR
jgi:hypothetical protein